MAQAAVLIAQPSAVLQALAGPGAVPPAAIMRVLGIRNLVQAVVETLRPRADVLAVGAAVDVTHAASMLAAAWVWPQYRRTALVSAGAAAASAALGVRPVSGGCWSYHRRASTPGAR